ncbi:MAG: DUF4268 domain-containing protein [Chloroflexi bacterium]|nr:DUF4268 domain-containing protein [Chloroflexota bacterium]
MADIDVATLSSVDLRRVWPREDADFTPWLADNLDVLGKELGMDLELVETEARAGSFSADILANERDRDREVIIENQLERTNHDHLGKMLTYAASHDVGIIVWISKEMRDEHRQAFDWLNQRTGSDTEFYGVVVQAVSIDSSRPACLFEVVAQPNETRKTVVDSGGRRPSERQQTHLRFWRLVLDGLRDKLAQARRRRPVRRRFLVISTEIPNVEYHMLLDEKRARVEFWLDWRDRERSEKLFDLLEARKSEIEGLFGEPLVWERRNPWGSASWICVYWNGQIDLADEKALGGIASWMVNQVFKFSSNVTPIARQLVAELDEQRQDPLSDEDTA